MATRALSATITPSLPNEGTLNFPTSKLICAGLELDMNTIGVIRTGEIYANSSIAANSANSSGKVIIQGYPSDPTTYGGLWIGVTPSDTNYTFLATGGGSSFCNAAVDLYLRIANVNKLSVLSARLEANVPVRLKGYTVATLPAGTVGDTAYVTDATAPTYNGALTGGGAVTVPVFYNGSAWVSA